MVERRSAEHAAAAAADGAACVAMGAVMQGCVAAAMGLRGSSCAWNEKRKAYFINITKLPPRFHPFQFLFSKFPQETPEIKIGVFKIFTYFRKYFLKRFSKNLIKHILICIFFVKIKTENSPIKQAKE